MINSLKPTALLLLVFATALGSAQTTNGRASGLRAADLAKIRATKLHFVLPTRVPAGYKVSKVELHRDKDPMMVELGITYRKGKSEIVISQASEGIGDLIMGDDADRGSEGRRTIRVPVVKDPGVIEYQRVKGSPAWGVSWLTLSGKRYPRFILGRGDHSPYREGITIMQSLRFLK